MPLLKKLYIFLLCLISVLIFSSCGIEIDASRYSSKEFKKDNQRLFLNEACIHSFEYGDPSMLSDMSDPNLYHVEYCNNSGCALAPVLEPHTLEVSEWIVNDAAMYRENGHFYHRIARSCKKCKKSVIFYVYCPLQDPNCTKGGTGNTCLFGCDWKELLADTPYLLVDPPPKTEESEAMTP